MKQEYSTLVTVEFVVSTQAANKRTAQRKINRVVFGTITRGVANDDDMVRPIEGKKSGVRIERQGTIRGRIFAQRHDDFARDLVHPPSSPRTS